MKTVKLINGPYNGREIEDSGADPIRMGIYDHTKPPGVSIGMAIYIPGEGRECAFWDGNDWAGKLDETISA